MMKENSMLINLIIFKMNVSQIISVSRQSKLIGYNTCSSLIMPMATYTWIFRYAVFFIPGDSIIIINTFN